MMEINRELWDHWAHDDLEVSIIQADSTYKPNLLFWFNYIYICFPNLHSLVKNSKLNLKNGFNLFSIGVVIHECNNDQ